MKLPAKHKKVSATIQTATTAELENFGRDYEHATAGVSEFERSAILKGIGAELAERSDEMRALK